MSKPIVQRLKNRAFSARARLGSAGATEKPGNAALRRRVAALEAEVQENRRLNRRIAELTDVVEELLLPPELRDEERLRARLRSYTQGA